MTKALSCSHSCRHEGRTVALHGPPCASTPTWSQPVRVHTLILALTLIAAVWVPRAALAGNFVGTCSASDIKLYADGVRECAPDVLSKRASTWPAQEEWRKSSNLCQPGCMCSMDFTEDMSIQYGPTSGACEVFSHAYKAEVVEDILIFSPGILCSTDAYNTCFCPSQSCEYRCLSPEKSSCVDQLLLTANDGGASASDTDTSPDTDVPTSAGADDERGADDVDERSDADADPEAASGEKGTSTGSSPSSSGADDNTEDSGSGLSTEDVIGIVSGVVGGIAVITGLLALFIQMRDRRAKANHPTGPSSSASSPNGLSSDVTMLP